MVGYQLGAAALVRCDLLISQGADQDFVFRYGTRADDGSFVGTDLSAWSARSQFRTKTGDNTAWLTATTNQADPDMPAITLGADGTVTMHIPYQATEGGAWNTRSNGVWDLELTSDTGLRVRLVEGDVVVDHDVTRDADGS